MSKNLDEYTALKWAFKWALKKVLKTASTEGTNSKNSIEIDCNWGFWKLVNHSNTEL